MDKYIVSARKYRPATFDSVIGQHTLTTTLKNAIEQKKLAHAYLFCGPRGVGKTTCARIFAKTINCLEPQENGEACDHCESCQAFNEQRSYNVYELDAASNNSVDDIRELIEQVQVPPQLGKYKVFIIDEVHMLSPAAFNAFLKTLEEPPAHAIFILATTEKHKILPTILSRCQIYDFSRMTVNDMMQHLEYVAKQESITYEAEALHVIAEKADGGMRDALSIFDQVASYCEGNITYEKVIEDLNVLDYDEYFSTTDLLLKGDIPQTMLRLNHILSKGFEANYFIGGLASHFRNLLMSREEATLPLLDVSEKVQQRYHEQALRCEPKLLYRVLKLCNDCDINYRTARNKRLLVEITLIQVAQVATGDEDAGCGRRPTRRLKPIFQTTSIPQPAVQAPQPSRESRAAYQPATAQQVDTTPSQVSEQSRAAQASASLMQQLGNTATGHKPSRGARTLSISALRTQYHNHMQPGTNTVQSVTQTTNPPHGSSPISSRLEYPFTVDQLTYYWYSFAQNLPKEQTAMAGRMKSMKPQISENWLIEVEVENEMVEQYMHELQIPLMNYLRTNLRNDAITLKFHITANNVTRAFSRTEQFKEMLEECTALATLKEKLNLELA
ncbi:DNA polymerase III, gamma and tau subunits [gut metagenome]|uniref:DNA-directed DNA polymerase n=1 Tax=gut metagenome TaxID=749906 RepID=J9GBW1_9ZZZZ